MSKSTDRILAAIDAGMQDSWEPAYGEGDWPWARTSEPVCVRCHGPLEDGELCQGCRAFLLEDSDRDPIISAVDCTAEDAVFDWYRAQIEQGTVTVGGTRVAEPTYWLSTRWSPDDMVGRLMRDEVPASGYARSSGLTRRGAELLRQGALEATRQAPLHELIDEFLDQCYDRWLAEGGILEGLSIEFDDSSLDVMLYGQAFRIVGPDGTSQPLRLTDITFD